MCIYSLKRNSLENDEVNITALETTFSHVKGIDLGYNDLTQFPEITTMQYMLLRSNQIQTLNLSLFTDTMKELKYCDLTENSINTLIPNADLTPSTASHMEYLVLTDNNISSVNFTIFSGLQKLIRLDLYSNPILTISPSVYDLTSLEDLRLSEALISVFDLFWLDSFPLLAQCIMTGLTELETLIASGEGDMQLQFSTFEITGTTLATLDLNILHYMPSTITLLFYSNNISIIIPVNDKVDNEASLDLSQNLLKGTFNLSLFDNITNIKSLKLNSNGITHLEKPEGVWEMLEYFAVQENELTYMNMALFENMPNIETIYLTTNKIATLATSNVVLEQVVTFYIGENKLQYFDMEFLFSIPNVTYLRIEFNNISEIVDNLNSSITFPWLEVIYSNWNKITVLNMTTIERMPRLKTLHIEGNGITQLSPSFCEYARSAKKLHKLTMHLGWNNLACIEATYWMVECREDVHFHPRLECASPLELSGENFFDALSSKLT